MTPIKSGPNCPDSYIVLSSHMCDDLLRAFETSASAGQHASAPTICIVLSLQGLATHSPADTCGSLAVSAIGASTATVHSVPAHVYDLGKAHITSNLRHPQIWRFTATPLSRPALCRRPVLLETMRTVIDVLLELGGDLSAVNAVGNDFVAVAGIGCPHPAFCLEESMCLVAGLLCGRCLV